MNLYGSKRMNRNSTGLTLFELLVVIAIIGIASTVVVLSFELSGSTKDTRIDAKHLVNLVRLAVDESIITGSDIGLELTPNGYRFLHYEYDQHGAKKWHILETNGPLRARTLPPTVILELTSIEEAPPGSVHDEINPQPQIIFGSSAELVDRYST